MEVDSEQEATSVLSSLPVKTSLPSCSTPNISILTTHPLSPIVSIPSTADKEKDDQQKKSCTSSLQELYQPTPNSLLKLQAI